MSTRKPHWIKCILNVLIKDNYAHFIFTFILRKIKINVDIGSRFRILRITFSRTSKISYLLRMKCYTNQMLNNEWNANIDTLKIKPTHFLKIAF